MSSMQSHGERTENTATTTSTKKAAARSTTDASPTGEGRKKKPLVHSFAGNDFDSRLKRSTTCVIGANYGENDTRRWSSVDRHYMAIPGSWSFNWNRELLWRHIFIDEFKKKDFDGLYIDRGTLTNHIRSASFENLLNTLYLYTQVRKSFNIGTIMVPKWDVDIISSPREDHDEGIEVYLRAKYGIVSASLIAGYKYRIIELEQYAKTINKYLEKVGDGVVHVAKADFVAYKFK